MRVDGAEGRRYEPNRDDLPGKVSVSAESRPARRERESERERDNKVTR